MELSVDSGLIAQVCLKGFKSCFSKVLGRI